MTPFRLTIAILVLAGIPYAQQLPVPIFRSGLMPRYPPIAAAARVEGEVRVSFKLDESGNVTSANVLSGHPMLRESAAAVVRSWKFELPKDLYRTEWKYETTFSYHMSGRELDEGENLRLTIVMDSFKHVEIISDTFKPAAMD